MRNEEGAGGGWGREGRTEQVKNEEMCVVFCLVSRWQPDSFLHLFFSLSSSSLCSCFCFFFFFFLLFLFSFLIRLPLVCLHNRESHFIWIGSLNRSNGDIQTFFGGTLLYCLSLLLSVQSLERVMSNDRMNEFEGFFQAFVALYLHSSIVRKFRKKCKDKTGRRTALL